MAWILYVGSKRNRKASLGWAAYSRVQVPAQPLKIKNKGERKMKITIGSKCFELRKGEYKPETRYWTLYDAYEKPICYKVLHLGRMV